MAMQILAHAEIEQAEKVLPPVLAMPANIDIHVMRFGAPQPSCDVVDPCDDIVVAFAAEGMGRAIVNDIEIDLTQRCAVVASGGVFRVERGQAATVLAVRLPRTPMQICASVRHGGARRLMRGALALDLDRPACLAEALLAVAQGQASDEHARFLLEGIVDALAAQHGADTPFPPSRAITLARAWLDRDASGHLSHHELAGRVGITGVTLQRGFKAILGTTVTRYSQAVRLHDAQARLQCMWECRSIAEIALAAGFPSSTTFTRAYQKLFEETPTQTRIRVFRMSVPPHDNLE